MKNYIVQVAIIKEIQVEAVDDLHAEQEAYKSLGSSRHAALAMRVLEENDPGALTDADTLTNWEWAKDNFYALDLDWLEPIQ
jgi:hypothetical protein